MIDTSRNIYKLILDERVRKNLPHPLVNQRICKHVQFLHFQFSICSKYK